MLYRTMPKNGDRLSALGFGCMRFPMKDGAIDEERTIAQLRSAVDSGVNYLDTAWPYHGGASEPMVGKALRGGYREKVKLATKLPTWLINSSADMDKYLDAQLEKLETDHIDYYLVHSLSKNSWERIRDLGVLDFLDKAAADGRIVNSGFSYHGMGQDFAGIVDAYPWVFCQIQYNLMDRDYQAGQAGLEYAHSKGLGVIIMEPLRGGYLGSPNQPESIMEIWDESDVKRTPVEWALRWIWNRPEVTVVISGMNEESHIAENLKIASEGEAFSLTEKELKLADRVADKYNEIMRVNCTGCAYCMPCPVGVNIPGCFDAFNKIELAGGQNAARFSYVLTGGVMSAGKTGFASQCIECGECIEKCPQNIAIPDVLKEVEATFEGEGFKEVSAQAAKIMRGGS